MEKLEKLVEIGAIVLEVFESIGEMIGRSTSNSVLSRADSLLFLTTERMGFSGSGLTGKFADMGQMMIQLAELILIVVVLFFALSRLFEFVMYKKQEMCWKFFLRMVVVGILAGGAYYLCFGAVFFTQNVTDYVRNYLGEEKVSFSVVEKKIESIKFSVDDESGAINLLEEDNMIKVCAYIGSVLVSFSLGMRYLLLELAVLFSPIFIMFGGFSGTKALMLGWLKFFLGLLSLQVFVTVLLGIFSFQPFGTGQAEMILIVAFFMILLMMNKIMFDFCLKKY